jgi:Right handed beta helix region
MIALALAAAAATAACGGTVSAGAPAQTVPPAPTFGPVGLGAGSGTIPPTAAASDPVNPNAAAVTCPSGGTSVSDGAALRVALASAAPGTVITLRPGTYTGAFTITRSGTQAAPIWVCGGRDALIQGTGTGTGSKDTQYLFHIDHASWVRLVGFTLRNGQKGVMTDGTQHSIIAGLSVSDIGDEGIHLRSYSSDNLVTGNVVRDTGHRSDKFGEGIYIGSANSNWAKYSGGGPDTSDRNAVIGNQISDTTAENIDIKEGTTGGTVSGNVLSSAGMVGADSWIDVKGNGWLIENNTGTGGGDLHDGIQVHAVKKGWGERNTIRANTLTVNAAGYGVYVQKTKGLGDVVGCDNVATGAAAGMSNQSCSSS